MLRFASPLLCALVQQRAYSAARDPPWFSAYARLCLLYPYASLGIDAAEYVRRSWHATGRLLDGEVALSDVEYSNRELVVVGTGDAAVVEVDGAPVNAIMLPGLRGVQLKEEPNKFSADVVVLQYQEAVDDKNALLTVHRIQIKLGDSKLDASDATEIGGKLADGAAVIAAAVRRSVGATVDVEVALYLATTRPLVGEAARRFVDCGVAVWDRASLAPSWAPCIAEWAGVVGVAPYLPPPAAAAPYR
jgi:hypothetical protein